MIICKILTRELVTRLQVTLPKRKKPLLDTMNFLKLCFEDITLLSLSKNQKRKCTNEHQHTERNKPKKLIFFLVFLSSYWNYASGSLEEREMLWEQKENYFYFIIMSTEHFSVLCLYQIMEILVINRSMYRPLIHTFLQGDFWYLKYIHGKTSL